LSAPNEEWIHFFLVANGTLISERCTLIGREIAASRSRREPSCQAAKGIDGADKK
jgi:hypothetical protein